MVQRGDRYPARRAWLLDNPIRRWISPPSELVEKLAIISTDVVVDFGCGSGYYTIELAKSARAVIAIDVSQEMLKKARGKAAKTEVKNVRFLLSDGRNLDLEDSSADVIVLVTVYHEIDEGAAVLEEFSRVLKPSGRLIIVEVVKRGIFPGAPVQNPEELKAEIEATNFSLKQMLPYKKLGIFFFAKNA